MTQENDAAGRAQNVNESFDATTAVADESFAQDWLNAEGIENVEANAAPRSSVVATLPDWTTFSSGNVERRERRAWREILRGGVLRTSGVALAAFGLGFFCAIDRRSDEPIPNDAEFVASKIDSENEKSAATLSIAADEASFDALTTIDSSTLRSVPDARSVDFIAGPNAAKDSAGSEDWGSGEVLAGNVGFADANDWENGGGNFDAGSTAPANAAAGANEGDASSWRRGVDLRRGSANATANVERFPTWDELETNANAPTFAETPNLSNGIATSVAPNGATPAVVGVGNNYYPSENRGATRDSNVVAAPNVENNVDYIAYGGNAGYRPANVANLTGDATQFAGNSQNSGYNQVDGSENFAAWPTIPAPVSAPDLATTVPGVSSGFGASAPVSAPDLATTVPGASSGFGASAPVSAGWGTAAPVAEPTRAMVAQVPSENPAVATPNVPVANPNLRW